MDLQEFIDRVHREAKDVVGTHTVALLGVQNDEPKQNGSGVLVKIADVGLLLSATHVLDCATVHKFPHLIGGARGGADLIPLEGVEVRSLPDPHDVSVVRLKPAIVEKLEEAKRFLRLSQIDPVVRSEAGDYDFILGFPFAVASNDLEARIAHVTSYSCGTYPLDGSGANIDNLDPQRDLVLAAPDGQPMDAEGNAVDRPRLGGVSGCGMWRLWRPGISPSNWSVDDIRLIGIEHSVLHGSYIRGTRIAVVNQLIWDSFPDLRASIEITFGRPS